MTVIENSLSFSAREVAAAQALENQVLADARDLNAAYWRLAEHMQQFIAKKAWLPLRYATFDEWAIAKGPKTPNYLRSHAQAWRLRTWLLQSGDEQVARTLDDIGAEKMQALAPALNTLRQRELGKPKATDTTPEATPYPLQSAQELILAAHEAPKMPEVRAVADAIVSGKHVTSITKPATFFTPEQRSELGMSDARPEDLIFMSWSYMR